MSYTYCKYNLDFAAEGLESFIQGLENVLAANPEIWQEVPPESAHADFVLTSFQDPFGIFPDNLFCISYVRRHNVFRGAAFHKSRLDFKNAELIFSCDSATQFSRSLRESGYAQSKMFFDVLQSNYDYDNAYELGQAVGRVLNDLMQAESYPGPTEANKPGGPAEVQP